MYGYYNIKEFWLIIDKIGIFLLYFHTSFKLDKKPLDIKFVIWDIGKDIQKNSKSLPEILSKY